MQFSCVLEEDKVIFSGLNVLGLASQKHPMYSILLEFICDVVVVDVVEVVVDVLAFKIFLKIR